MSVRRLPVSLLLGLLLAALTAVSVGIISAPRVSLKPGDPGFRRLVAGATPSGRVHDRALVSLPGFPRRSAGRVRMEVVARAVRFGVDGSGTSSDVRPDAAGVLVMSIPEASTPGARLVLVREEGEPTFRLSRVSVEGVGSRFASLLAFVATLLATSLLARFRGPRFGIACGLAMGGLCLLAATPALVWLTFPGSSAILRLSLVAAFAAASIVAGRRERRYARTVALLGALVLGAFLRWYFLPSAGSWDTEYWKAWTARASSHGVTRAYGDPAPFEPHRFVEELRGREPLFRIDYHGREVNVDYPPLMMVILKASRYLVSLARPDLDAGEAENASVKLPASIGDVAAVVLLLWLFRRRISRGLGLAALYWVLPLSWLSSAVLGYLDGAYVPIAVLALATAVRGRPGITGALVAIAGLIKPQGLILAPAALVALRAQKKSLLGAVVAGLAVVGIALVPFWLAGTLHTAVVHVFRILFQQRLSAGYANLWWIVGHLASGSSFLGSRVEFATLDSVPFSAGLLGTFGFVCAAGLFLWRQWRTRESRGANATFVAGAAVMFAYASLAIGVHENHPHPIFLALAATGLERLQWRVVASVLSVTYVLNMLCLSGLGRFYGLRFMAVEPIATAVSRLRMDPGFDLTLALAAINVCLFVWLVLSSTSLDEH